MNTDFGTNKTPIEVANEEAFGGTYFGDIYSGFNRKCYRKSWKEFNDLKSVDNRYYCLNYMTLLSINMVLNVEHC